LNRKKYDEVEECSEEESIFTELIIKGFKTYVIWPFEWKELAWKYSKIFPEETNVIPLKGISENIQRDKKRSLIGDKGKSINAIKLIISELDTIASSGEDFFVWVHLPHVIKGQTSYGSDIDLFDKFIGEVRDIVDDDSIYISSDHGHMNMDKGIPVYGFHAYQGTTNIPMITPRIDDLETVEYPTSNIQLKEILIDKKLNILKYIIADTQYYVQENRKLAIIKGDYKYIYNKNDNTEELYDLKFDPSENVNLLSERIYDRNRLGYYNLDEIYYYPNWSSIENIYLELKTEKKRIWRDGNWLEEKIYKLNDFSKRIKKLLVLSKKRTKGRFSSNIRISRFDT